jgi:RimJ/RimL family protein N-acetyltransferase
VRVRRAEPADADFVAGLLVHDEVEPFLSARRPRGRDDVLATIEHSQAEPNRTGLFVIEVDGERAGIMEFATDNERSRIAYLGGLALDPRFRGHGHAEGAARAMQRHLLLDLGFHRLQLEIYGFNERAIRHAERVGFAHEGTKRRAYRRHGGWQDGVMFGFVREDLGLPPGVDMLYEYVARHNQGVRTGDWEALGELLTDGALLELDGIDAGPFAGPEAIVRAYAERPPDDEVRVLSAEEGDPVVARYAWLAAPGEDAGRIELTPADGLVARILVGV